LDLHRTYFEKPYNSAFVINPEGKRIETYHKTFSESYFEPGEKPERDLIAKRTENPGVLVCDIDITQAKNDGHLQDRRPDIYFK